MNIFDLQATISLNADKLISGLQEAQNSFSGLDEVASESAGNLADAFSQLEQPVSNVAPMLQDIGDAAGDAAAGVDEIGDSTSDAADGLSDVASSATEAGSGLKDAGSAAISAGEDAEKSVPKWGSLADTLGGVLKAAGLLTAGLGGVAVGAFKVASDAAYAADDLNTLSKQTGISTEDLQKFKYASDLIDVSVDTFTGSLTRLTRNMNSASKGTGTAGEAFDALGISITDADGSLRNNQEVFYDVIDALADVENYTERDAMAMEIFGRSAQDLNPLILGGSESLKELGKQAEDAGLILSQDSLDSLNELSDALDRAKATASSFSNVLGTAFAPSIAEAVDSVTGFAQEISGAFSEGFDTGGLEGALSAVGDVISGKLSEISPNTAEAISEISAPLGDLSAAFSEAADAGIDEFVSTIQGLTENIDPSAAVSVFGEISGAVKDLAGAFASASADVINGVTGAVGGFLDSFAESDAPEAIGKLGENVGSFLSAFLTASADTISGIAGSVKEFLDAFGESDVGEIIGDIAASAADLLGDFLIAGEDIIKGVADGIKKFFDVFDESAAVEAIESVAGVIAKVFDPFTDALGNAIKKAGEGLGDVASNIGELAGHLANDFVDKIKDLADNFEKWAPWVAAVASALVTMKVISEIVPMVSTLKTLFLDLPSITELLSTAFSTLGMVFNSFGGPIGIAITAAVALTTALATAYATNEDFRNSVDGAVKAIGDGVRAAASAVASFFTETLPEAFSAFVDWIWELNDEIGSFFTETIPEKFNEMIDWFSDLPDKFKEIGENIVEGIKNGFTSKWNEFKNWVGDLTSGITGFVKGIFGENSPSKVFAEIGLNLVAGMEVGWGREFGALERQVEQDLDSLTDTARMKFADSAIGRSSAAGISSNMALYGQRGGDSVEINLVLDGDVAARALYDPLRRAEAQKGMRKEAAYA